MSEIKCFAKPTIVKVFKLHDPDEMDSVTAEEHNSALCDFMNGSSWYAEQDGVHINYDDHQAHAKRGDYIIKNMTGNYSVCLGKDFAVLYQIL